MKPATRTASAAPATKRRFLARFFSAPDTSDPLYLTNQTWGQKACRLFLISAPLALLVAGVMAVIVLSVPKTPKQPKELTKAEIAAIVLPNFNPNIKLDSNKALEVVEVHFEHAASDLIMGNFRNKSDQPINQAVVVFDLTDASGSQIGGITITEANVQPGATRQFHQAIDQPNAKYAVVREVRTQ